MVYRSVFKFLPFVVLLTAACGDLPRDNALDPKNPDSKSPQAVMIEAFVNTANPAQFNENMLGALDAISENYDGQVLIAEYHRNTQAYEDPFHLSISEVLYTNYLSAVGADIKGVPDVFINGTQFRVQGASSVVSATQRLEDAVLAATLNENSRFLLLVESEKEGNQITPVITIARLGDRDIEQILVKCVLVSDLGEMNLRRVVQGSAQGQLILRLKHGEHQILELPEIDLPDSGSHQLIAYVTDASQTMIYQATSADVR